MFLVKVETRGKCASRESKQPDLSNLVDSGQISRVLAEDRAVSLVDDERQPAPGRYQFRALQQGIVARIFDTELTDDQIKHLFANTPQVQQCYYVTGEADFVLLISVASMAEYEELTRTLFFENEMVRKFKTFVSMDRVKTSLALPL